MQQLVRQALQSEETKAAILSLIAKSNEANQSPSPVPLGENSDPGREVIENPVPDSKPAPEPNE